MNNLTEKIREKKLLSSYSLSYKIPLHIIRGRAQYMFSISGTRYMDLVNNVCHIGHCHPKVVKVFNEQISTLNVNTRYLHPNIVNYSVRLGNLFPNPLKIVIMYFI